MKKITLLIFFFLSALSLHAQTPEQLWSEGHSAYGNGDYQKAIENYEAIVKLNDKSGDAHYNLGNAYFRGGKLGPAIFHYLKAQKFIPRNPDLKFNLNYVRGKTVDKIEGATSLAQHIPFLPAELLIITAFLSIVFWATMSILLFKKNYTLGWLRNLSLIFLLLFGTAYFFKIGSQNPFAVITSAEANVYSTTGKDAIKLFTLHEGAEAEVLDQMNDKWMLLRLKDGKKGWIESVNLLLEN